MKITISIFLLGITLSSVAQNDSKVKQLPSITRSIGVSFQKFDGLNSRVANFPQFETLRDYTATIGLGWLKEHKRVISAGSINLGSSMSGDRDKKSSTIRYFGVTADIGYDVLKSEKVMLYPLVGLGYQGYQAIFFKDNSAVLFNDVMQSPTVQNNIRSVRFNNSFLLYRLGFGVSIKSTKHPENSIGLQAGYSGSFKKRMWRSSENQLLGNAPEDNLSQFNVGIIFINKPNFMK